jgi:hypothetical protein
MLARLDDSVPPGASVVLFEPAGNDARFGISNAVRERNVSTKTDLLVARGIKVTRVPAAFEVARPGNPQPDGIHFTLAGHDMIARLLVDRVAAALDR